ncbi:hypothetical protein QL285_088172 [Trifolium repens]|nr:hypothetical protein QL285_088172 [Trifolium repens]
MNYYNQENQSAKSPQENNFFLEERIKKRDMHEYKFGVKSPRSMKLHPKNKSSTGIVEGMVKQTWSYQIVIHIKRRWPVLQARTKEHRRETCEPILCNGGNASC